MSGKRDGEGLKDDGKGRDARTAPDKARKGKKRDDQVSRVLKTVYDDTLREDIPDEFEDLLRKLD